MKTSRSAIECFRECPRKRYLRYHHDGLGIQRVGFSPHLMMGSFVHKGLELLLRGGEPRAAIQEAHRFIREEERFSEELEKESLPWLTLGEGLIWAWNKIRLPHFREHYEIVMTEEEIETPISDDVILCSRLDAVLRRKSDQALGALEFKTTGWLDSDWIQSWRDDMQGSHHYFAIEQTFQEPCQFLIYDFLYKGYKKGNLLYSPLVRGFQSRDMITGDLLDLQWDGRTFGRKKGYEAFNIHEFLPEKGQFSASEYWCCHVLDYETLSQQLASIEVWQSPQNVAEWLETIRQQEGQIAADLMRNGPCAVQFPAWKSRDRCSYNVYRRACPYRDICYDLIELEHALDSGLYEVRKPHHSGEIEEAA